MIARDPVRVAISSSIALRRSPNPGAFTATAFMVLRRVFTTRVARASPSMSSAITSIGRCFSATFSRRGSRSLMLEIFFSWRRTYGFSSTHSIRSPSVMKYGER